MGTAVLSEIDQSKQNIFSRNIYAYVVDTMGGGGVDLGHMTT